MAATSSVLTASSQHPRPEQGRHPDQIVCEARTLADQGCKEITLLGQTVNSYKFKHDDGSATDMAALLEQLHPIDGIERIKFVTNYPKDMTERLLETIRDLPKVSPYLACAGAKWQ